MILTIIVSYEAYFVYVF